MLLRRHLVYIQTDKYRWSDGNVYLPYEVKAFASSRVSGSATTRSLMLAYTLLLNLCVRHFGIVLVRYFVVGMKQEESDHPLPAKLTPLVHTLSPVSHTLPT
jgi:hypothetical protein